MPCQNVSRETFCTFPIKQKQKVGIFLFSQVVSNQVSSALPGLTSVFGMGTGGPPASLTPTELHGLLPTRCIYSSWLLPCKYLFILFSLVHLYFPGDSCGNRTRVTGVRGRCLNRLTNEPRFPLIRGLRFSFRLLTSLLLADFGAPSGIRTRDTLIKSQVLYQLS